jgi:phenylalanyl-tRNA synthetase beta chain
MNASYQWLKDFVDVELTPIQLRDLITAHAATVEDVVALRDDLAGIVVGRVVEKQPHPDSDHLNLTKVDAGTGELLDVVCGAPNVVVGTLYPFAPVGATLPGGLKIEKRKIRGHASTGMLCSARELGLGGDHAGILALDIDVAPGTPFLKAMPVGDTRLVIDVLPNRPDLLSHEGVAREIAALTGRPAHLPRVDGKEIVAAAPEIPFANDATAGETAGVHIRIDAAECSRYAGTIIRGVKVGPSPAWLVARLEGAGVRSINNVVDVTNYMLHGFGQPMHAFDANKIGGNSIIVRRAAQGEKIVTLDGVERTLTAAMLVIADAAVPQAIAGIIGGRGSEVDESTTDIVLEVAAFDPMSVRNTRKALVVSTDASYRFERALDASRIGSLSRYAAALMVAVAGGAIDGIPLIVGSTPTLPKTVTLRPSRVAQLLGDPVPVEECIALLQRVGFTVEAGDANALRVTSPTWRSDVTLEADLIEEIARLRGYDSFTNELRPFRVNAVSDASSYTMTRRVTALLAAAGLYEVRPIPFVADAGEAGVRIRNPLADNEGMLRSSVLPTLARRVEHNFAHMVRDVRLFEVGVVFMKGDGTLPIERTHAAVVLTGGRYQRHFTNAKPEQFDLWDAKWIAEQIGDATFGRGRLMLEPNDSGTGWNAVIDGAIVGAVGPIVVDAPVWASPVYGIEIDITSAFGVTQGASRYTPLPVTPASEFDLALAVPDAVSAFSVEQVIRTAAGDLLESLAPFDEFRGKGIAEGTRSVAWRLTLRHPDRTLKEKEIEGRRDKILRTLDQELGVRPRAS